MNRLGLCGPTRSARVAAIRKQRRSSGTAPSTASPTGASSLPWTRARARNGGATTRRWIEHSRLRARTGASAAAWSPRHRAYGDAVISPVIDAVSSRSMRPREGSLVNAILPDDPPGYSITMAPRIARGKAIVGVAGGEFTPHRGFFVAIDVRRPRTVALSPCPAIRRSRSRIPRWPPPRKRGRASGEGGGGGSLWDGLSYDPEANLIYVGTGNGAPWPEILRGSEGRTTCTSRRSSRSMPTRATRLALSGGARRFLDIDNVQQLILADTTIDGRERKVLMQASKRRILYVLDRLTGEFISATPFAPLNWARGHDPKTGRPLINKEAYYTMTAGGDFTGVGRRRELGGESV